MNLRSASGDTGNRWNKSAVIIIASQSPVAIFDNIFRRAKSRACLASGVSFLEGVAAAKFLLVKTSTLPFDFGNAL